METSIQQVISTPYVIESSKPSVTKRFFKWCADQEPNRFGWLGASLAGHGCVFTPLTMFAIVLAGNSIFLWMVAIVAMGASLITNLAAMPTKITIPVFLFSVLVDLAIIVACISIGFNINGVFA